MIRILLSTVWLLLASALPKASFGEDSRNAPVTCVMEHIALEIQGGGKKAKEKTTRVYAIHRAGETSEAFETIVLPWTFTHEPKNAWVEIRNASGVSLEKKFGDFVIHPFLQEGNFVSDSEVIVLQIPSLEAGDTLTIFSEYKISPFLGQAPLELGSVNIPHEGIVLEVTVPRDLDPRYRSWNEAGDPVEEKDGDKVVWTWRLGPIEFPPPEPLGPPDEDLLPVVSIGVNRIAWGPADTWEAIGKSYFEKISEILRENESLPPVDLLEPGGNASETAGACLSWVQDQLRYVNIALGPGGFIPHEPDEIYRRKYGDCKDMSTLLLSVLDQFNIPGSIAAVCTRPRAGYIVEPLPNLRYFNHAVVCAGDSLWLDATDNYGTTWSPRSDIQGAPALVLSGPNAGFQRIPMSPSHTNSQVRSVHLQQQEGGTWMGSLELTLTGTYAHQVFASMLDDDVTKVIHRLVKSELKREDVLEENVSLLFRNQDSLIVSYETSIADPLADGKFNPSWDTEPFPLNLLRARERWSDVYWPFLFQTVDSLLISLWKPGFETLSDTSWTENVQGLEVTMSRRSEPRELLLTRTLRTNAPVLPVEGWREARSIRTRSMRWSTRSYSVRGD